MGLLGRPDLSGLYFKNRAPPRLLHYNNPPTLCRKSEKFDGAFLRFCVADGRTDSQTDERLDRWMDELTNSSAFLTKKGRRQIPRQASWHTGRQMKQQRNAYLEGLTNVLTDKSEMRRHPTKWGSKYKIKLI